MNYKLKSPVDNFIKWENLKGEDTFLIQPINGNNQEFTWSQVGEEARKVCSYINSFNFQKNQKLRYYQKIVHTG